MKGKERGIDGPRTLGGSDEDAGDGARDPVGVSVPSLSQYLTSAPLPLALVSPEEGRILDVSPLFASLVGRSTDDLLGRELPTLFANPPEVEERLRVSGNRGQNEPGILVRSVGAGGRSMFLTAWRFGPHSPEDGTDPDSEVDDAVAVLALADTPDPDSLGDELGELIRMVNEALLFKALREMDRANAEARDNRAKSVFLASISHELRTPLNSILGHIQLLREGIPIRLPDPLEPHVERIDRAADHLRDLIEQVITASRAEIEEPDAEDEVDIGELVVGARDMLAPQAESKGLALEVDVEPGISVVRSHERHLRQILVNLLSNAVKFTDEGSVRLEVVGDGWLVFRVRDTGIGIAAEDQPRIFDRFWQVRATSVRDSEGMGIGLWVTRSLVESLGGEIALESTPGEGSTFEVRVPWR